MYQQANQKLSTYLCCIGRGRRHGGAQHAVRILGVAVFAFASAELNVLGDMELRAVQGDQDTTIETQERFQSLMLRQLFTGHVESRIHRMTIDAIELFAEMVVGGNESHAKQGLASISVASFVELSLMVKG